MILKERKTPQTILKLEALARRLAESHSKMPLITKELGKRQAGYRGEQSIDYHLSFLPEKEYYILHDLRLKNQQGYYFQIDTLLLSHCFLSIIDVKNFRGIIQFDEQFHQLIQTVNETKKGLSDPISQINRHHTQLTEWLKVNKFPSLPIQPLIVISNPATVIETTSNPTFYKQITHSINLFPRINQFKKSHSKEILSHKDILKLGRLLTKKNHPLDYNPLKHYGIHPNEILKGVHCPSCNYLPMKRVHGKWQCPRCKHMCKMAHLNALNDYNLLLGNTITNENLCEFLLLHSRNAALHILRSMNLQHSGNTKGRLYYLPE